MNDIFKSWLVENYIAHRGFHDQDAPENSLLAFENAIKKGYAIELDVHLISDGEIVVIHDDTLKRMTSKDGYVKNLKSEDLKDYKLLGTEQYIPTLNQVLELVNGQVPILIEIKNNGKVGELESKLHQILQAYNGEYAVQSFNPYSLQWFNLNAPEVLRGQLSGYLRGTKLGFFKKFALKRMLLNKSVSKPHFISYEAEALPNAYVKRYKNLPLLCWTVRSQEQYNKVIKHCDNIIFEGFEPMI